MIRSSRSLSIYIHRRKSIIIKILLIVPITWIIISVLLSTGNNVDNEDDVENVDNGRAIDVVHNEGRRPRQSEEDGNKVDGGFNGLAADNAAEVVQNTQQNYKKVFEQNQPFKMVFEQQPFKLPILKDGDFPPNNFLHEALQQNILQQPFQQEFQQDFQKPIQQEFQQRFQQDFQQQPIQLEVDQQAIQQNNAFQEDQQQDHAQENFVEEGDRKTSVPDNLAVIADQGFLPNPEEEHRPGDWGKPVRLKNLTAEQQKLVDAGWQKNAFNQYISDMVPLHRALPDARPKGCQDEKYSDILPPTSVIICFHNEAWSTLLRTAHSVLDRSPPELIQEILLVDDFSDLPHLEKQLDDYVSKYEKLKVVRTKKREGLIRARLVGAAHASAPVLTYLDSHCECAHGWLEPLLQRIANNWTTVVCPVIDVIDDDTFQYNFRVSGELNVGGFDWNLQFNWHALPEREQKRRQHTWDPVWSPTMAGGLFSISKKFFETLGTYDNGFDIWGGENLELSFKTWMCGGTLEIVPCSHVGHVFRKRSPYQWLPGVNVLRKNAVRLAEVWLDDFKEFYYQRIGNDLGDFGDVTSRRKLRQELKCKTFDWYLKTIYPELTIPSEAVAQGEIRNLADGGDTCLDTQAKRENYNQPIGLYPCHGQGGNQYFMLSKEGEIKRDEYCLDYAGDEVILYPCHFNQGNQLWYYIPNHKFILHNSSKKCMELSADKNSVFMAHCDDNRPRQKWLFDNYNSTKVILTPDFEFLR